MRPSSPQLHWGLACAVACTLMGCDGVVRVRWSLVGPPPSASADLVCSSSLRLADGDKEIAARPFIWQDRELSFTVYPRRRAYYVAIRCPGYRPIHTPVFTSDGGNGRINEIGPLELEAEAPNGAS